jgi:hypothetical protein
MLRSFQALRDPHWSGIIPARPEVVQGRIGTLGAVPSWLSHKNVCSPEGDSEGRVARPSNVRTSYAAERPYSSSGGEVDAIARFSG